MNIQIKLEKYLITKDDIGEVECNMCERSSVKKNETWYEGDFGNTSLLVCKDCFNKLSSKLNNINWCKLLDGIAWSYYNPEDIYFSDKPQIEGHDTFMDIDDVNERITKRINSIYKE